MTALEGLWPKIKNKERLDRKILHFLRKLCASLAILLNLIFSSVGFFQLITKCHFLLIFFMPVLAQIWCFLVIFNHFWHFVKKGRGKAGFNYQFWVILGQIYNFISADPVIFYTEVQCSEFQLRVVLASAIWGILAF